MATICEPTLSVLKEKQKIILDRIYRHHLRLWGGSEGKVFFISDLYHGVWLEHTYDAVAWANYMPSDHEISKNQVKLFLSKQKPDGQLPCYIWADKIGYSQTQECVSFTRLALEACGQNADDPDFLVQCYEACKKWDEWLCAARMPHKKGLIEMFCGFDTGHDNSGRLRDMKYPNLYSKDGAAMPDDDPVLPVLAPDMNAVFYGDRMALADMADKLGKADEAAIWRKKAEEVRQAIFEYCYNEEDNFFYDVDKFGKQRKIKSVGITNVLCEHVTDFELGNRIIERYLLNPNEFWSPYPFPGVSMSEPLWIRNLPGNSWGYYSQATPPLLTTRWMESYGRGAEMEEIMRRWVAAWTASETTQFGQELDPVTGEPSESSPWYSSCMVYYLISLRRLYNI